MLTQLIILSYFLAIVKIVVVMANEAEATLEISFNKAFLLGIGYSKNEYVEEDGLPFVIKTFQVCLGPIVLSLMWEGESEIED